MELRPREPWRIVWLLAITQILSWGSLYYAFTILAPAIERDTGWRLELIVGAYSLSLLIAGLASTPVGILIDRHGGRAVMPVGSFLSGCGMLGLAFSQTLFQYYAAWGVIGAGMSMVLYEAAFATINREFGSSSRKAISVLALFGGLASTVAWPLTYWLVEQAGWRDTCMIYGIINLAFCATLHACLVGHPNRAAHASGAAGSMRGHTLGEALRDRRFWALASAFSANMFIFAALSVHLIPMLERLGHPGATVLLATALIGPMQVAGRIAETLLSSRILPHTAGKVTFAILPAALLALIVFGEYAAAAFMFCMLYGTSNGVLTIVRGTVPQALFGRENYGAISGALAGPTLIARAAGPLLGAALVEIDPRPGFLLSILLAVSAISLVFFLFAVRSAPVSP